MKKVFISTTTFSQYSNDPIDILKTYDCEVVFNEFGRKLREAEIKKLIGKFDGVIAGTELYNAEVLKNAVKLKVISRLGVGLDNIDMVVAKKRDIKVYKTQTTPALAVAELTLGLIINCFRFINNVNIY